MSKGGGGSDIKTMDPLAGTGVRELYKQLNEWLGPQIGKAGDVYPGQIAPGADPLQQQGFNIAGGLGNLAQGGMDVFNQALQNYQPQSANQISGMAIDPLQRSLAEFDPASTQKNWEANMKPAFDLWKEDIVPYIQEKYANVNASDSGALNRALGRSGETFASNQLAQLSNSLLSGEQFQKGMNLQGMSQIPSLSMLPGNIMNQASQIGGMGSDFMSQLMNAGGISRRITGEQNMEGYNKWLGSQPYNNPTLQAWLGTALQQPGMDFVQNQAAPGFMESIMPALGAFAGSPAGSAGIVGLLGGAGGAAAAGGGMTQAAMLAGFLSDIRMKENIDVIPDALEKLGQLTGYMFDYIDTKERTGGIMAQDLEKVIPEGVKEIDGIKHVDIYTVVALLVNAVNELAGKAA